MTFDENYSEKSDPLYELNSGDYVEINHTSDIPNVPWEFDGPNSKGDLEEEITGP